MLVLLSFIIAAISQLWIILHALTEAAELLLVYSLELCSCVSDEVGEADDVCMEHRLVLVVGNVRL